LTTGLQSYFVKKDGTLLGLQMWKITSMPGFVIICPVEIFIPIEIMEVIVLEGGSYNNQGFYSEFKNPTKKKCRNKLSHC
jgi:hypothetical protein